MNKHPMTDGQEEKTGTRREFLRNVLAGTIPATVLMVYGPGVLAHREPSELPRGEGIPKAEHYWIYVININNCIGCGNCVRACKAENEVPDKTFRTWVERYIISGEGVHVESPRGALEGFREINAGVRQRAVKSYTVPKMCNHCHHPPCVKVCPVGATFKSPEGFVLVDWEYCIGCAFCVQACPYGARFINPKEHKADKCTWCYHRVKAGKLPACVTVCPNKARLFGDRWDAEAEVTKVFLEDNWLVLKPHLTTDPTCYYVGLGREVI
ncbi:MAG: 4Fe-4S dicluster domain-containing protein [Rhodospirillales bacterium]